MNDKNKHVTPPVVFVLEEKMREQQKEIDELLERLGKYEKKAQRDDKKICDMGIELFQVNERLRECEKSLRFYKWASLQELEENDLPKDDTMIYIFGSVIVLLVVILIVKNK